MAAQSRVGEKPLVKVPRAATWGVPRSIRTFRKKGQKANCEALREREEQERRLEARKARPGVGRWLQARVAGQGRKRGLNDLGPLSPPPPGEQPNLAPASLCSLRKLPLSGPGLSNLVGRRKKTCLAPRGPCTFPSSPSHLTT